MFKPIVLYTFHAIRLPVAGICHATFESPSDALSGFQEE